MMIYDLCCFDLVMFEGWYIFYLLFCGVNVLLRRLANTNLLIVEGWSCTWILACGLHFEIREAKRINIKKQ